MVVLRNPEVDEILVNPSKVEGAGRSGSVEVNGSAEVPKVEARGLPFSTRKLSVEQSSCRAGMQAASFVS